MSAAQRPPRSLLLIINLLTPVGGAETQLLHLARGLAGNGHEVTLACIDSSTLGPAELEGTGISLVELGARRRHERARAVGRLARLARRAEAVHCTMWDPSLWGRLAAILARRPVVVADHATDRSVQTTAGGAPRERWIALHNRLLDRFTFATVACASGQREVLVGEGVDPEKIVHIPNGIPIERLLRSAGAGPDRAELGLPPSAPVVTQVGLFRPEKNQAGALEAVALAREALGDVQLLFAGDGPLRAEVERRAEEIGAGDWVHFLGNRSDVPGLLAMSDVLLLPSDSDAMPMTVLEAMAIGVPVAATDVGDVKRVLGEGGICVPPGDVAKLAEACTRLLSDRELRERMGRAGSESAKQFDSSVMVARYEALFDAACEGGSPREAVASVG